MSVLVKGVLYNLSQSGCWGNMDVREVRAGTKDLFSWSWNVNGGSHREVEWTAHVCMKGCPFKVTPTVVCQAQAFLPASCGVQAWDVRVFSVHTWLSALLTLSSAWTLSLCHSFGSPSRELTWIVCQGSTKWSVVHLSGSQLSFVSSLFLCAPSCPAHLFLCTRGCRPPALTGVVAYRSCAVHT